MQLNRINSAIDRVERNKINENFDILERGYGKAFRDSQTAKEQSDYAVEISDEAKQQAESVQAQFNQVVIEGDSSVEAAQARVSADDTVYTTLKERLDTENVQIEQQLEKVEEARIGADSTVYDTLKARLDAENEQVTQQLAQIETKPLFNGAIAKSVNRVVPMVVLHFDDCIAEEWTKTKPLLDSLGVKASFMHNTSPNFESSRMSDAQLLQLVAEGHEIGVHTRDHAFLDRLSAPNGFTSGATTITVHNSNSHKLINIFAGLTTEITIVDSNNGNSENAIVTAVSEIVDDKITLTLAQPLTKDYPQPLVSYSEAFMEYQIAEPLDYLRKIGITARHFAYPYGSSFNVSQALVSKYFASARNASPPTANTIEVNGGVINGIEKPIEQYALASIDLGGSDTAHIETLLINTKNTNGLAILLGHAANFEQWSTQLTFAINKARELGIEIVTTSKALEMHGNLIDFKGHRVSRSGLPRGMGVDIRVPDSIPSNYNNWDYKEGFTFTNVESDGGTKGFPTNAGTLVHIRSTTESEHLGWAKDMWMDKNTNDIYVRRALNGNNIYDGWQKLMLDDERIAITTTIASVTVQPSNKAQIVLPGISLTTNNVVINFSERITDKIAVAEVAGLSFTTRVADGIAFLMVSNPTSTAYALPEIELNVVVFKI